MAVLRQTIAIWLCVLGLVVLLRVQDGYTLQQIIDHPGVLSPCHTGCWVVKR